VVGVGPISRGKTLRPELTSDLAGDADREALGKERVNFRQTKTANVLECSTSREYGDAPLAGTEQNFWVHTVRVRLFLRCGTDDDTEGAGAAAFDCDVFENDRSRKNWGPFYGALRRVVAGGVVVDPFLVKDLVNRHQAVTPLTKLSAREVDVLNLMAEGFTDRGIAESLVISIKTVQTHVASIFKKLDIPTDLVSNRRVHAVLQKLRSANPR
jgi:DNA-binding CsgD family transcriptional regulator